MKKGDVRDRLEEDLGRSLSSRKQEIYDLIAEVTREFDAEDDEDNEPIKGTFHFSIRTRLRLIWYDIFWRPKMDIHELMSQFIWSTDKSYFGM